MNLSIRIIKKILKLVFNVVFSILEILEELSKN